MKYNNFISYPLKYYKLTNAIQFILKNILILSNQAKILSSEIMAQYKIYKLISKIISLI